MAAKPEHVVNLIMSNIRGNTHIHDASHLTVDVKAKGFLFWKKHEVHIAGRVDTEREKEEIDNILETNAAGFTVINNLSVHSR